MQFNFITEKNSRLVAIISLIIFVISVILLAVSSFEVGKNQNNNQSLYQFSAASVGITSITLLISFIILFIAISSNITYQYI